MANPLQPQPLPYWRLVETAVGPHGEVGPAAHGVAVERASVKEMPLAARTAKPGRSTQAQEDRASNPPPTHLPKCSTTSPYVQAMSAINMTTPGGNGSDKTDTHLPRAKVGPRAFSPPAVAPNNVGALHARGWPAVLATKQ